MWASYVPGISPARSIPVSKELYDLLHEYCNNTKFTIQFVFDSGLYDLMRIWGDGSPSLEPANETCLKKVRKILRLHPIPGKIDRDYRIGIRIPSERAYDWMVNLETLAIFPCFEEGIRRVITWNITKED